MAKPSVEAAHQVRQFVQAQGAFIGGDRDRAFEVLQIRFAAALQWLLEERYLQRQQCIDQGLQTLDRISLVRIHAHPNVRTRRSYRLDARDIQVELAGEFQFERASLGVFVSAGHHGRGIVGA